MKILIVNAYSKNDEETFVKVQKIIKKMFLSQKELLDTETEFYVVDFDQLDLYIFEPESGYPNKESARLFDFIDIVFIDGDQNKRGFHKECNQLMILLRMCLRTNKILLAFGVGLQCLIYLIASNIERTQNLLNGPNGSKLGDISQLNKDFKAIRQNDFFLDNVTGDIYKFVRDVENWTCTGNIGLHSKIQASQQTLLGKYVLSSPIYRPKTQEHTLPTKQSAEEIVCYLKKQYMQHPLLENLPQKFLVYCNNTWSVHSFNFVNPNKIFISLAESDQGPLIIQVTDNIYATQFNLSDKYGETIKIFQNFMNLSLHKIRSSQFKSSNIIKATVAQIEDINPSPDEIKQIKFKEMSKFIHSGFTAKRQDHMEIVENNSINKLQQNETSKFFVPQRIKTAAQIKIRTEPDSINSIQKINFSRQSDELIFIFDKNQKDVRQMLHPMMKKEGAPNVSQVMRKILYKANISEVEKITIPEKKQLMKFTFPKSNLLTDKQSTKTQDLEDYDKCRKNPIIRCSSPYITQQQIENQEKKEKQKLNLGKDFQFTKPKIENIGNQMSQGIFQASSHQFRMQDKKKWVSSTDFRPY